MSALLSLRNCVVKNQKTYINCCWMCEWIPLVKAHWDYGDRLCVCAQAVGKYTLVWTLCTGHSRGQAEMY